VKKLPRGPLTLPSPVTPRREEGEHNEIKKKFPPPGWGRGRVGVKMELFLTFRELKEGSEEGHERLSHERL
jgi:hypothetical protein